MRQFTYTHIIPSRNECSDTELITITVAADSEYEARRLIESHLRKTRTWLRLKSILLTQPDINDLGAVIVSETL